MLAIPMIRLFWLLVCCLVAAVSAFVPSPIRHLPRQRIPTSVAIRVLRDLSDMLENFDDIVDDFMNKRMGNGEVFYGKRKYKPSGKPNTEGKYNGMGLSDKGRIDVAREVKAQFLERRIDIKAEEEGES